MEERLNELQGRKRAGSQSKIASPRACPTADSAAAGSIFGRCRWELHISEAHEGTFLLFAHWRQTSLFIATHSETHNLSKHMLARSAVRMVAANATKRVVPVDIVRCAKRCKPAFDICLLSHASFFIMMHRVDPRFNLAPIANIACRPSKYITRCSPPDELRVAVQ